MSKTLEVISAVDRYPIDPVLETYQRRTGKSLDHIRDEERELKRFLALCALYPDRRLPMFSYADDLWHEFICHTRLYHRFCHEVIGKYVHHEPYTETSPRPIGDHGELTITLYEQHFGRIPHYMRHAADCSDDHTCSSCSSCHEPCSSS